MKILKKLYKWFDKLLPPIKFKKKYFSKATKRLSPEEADEWATKIEEKVNERRYKRGTRN